MKLPLSDRQLRFCALYFKTVALAAPALFLVRLGDVSGIGGVLRLAADSVWQGSVWPLYLLLLMTGRG